MTGTLNILEYFPSALIDKEKSFITLTAGVTVMKKIFVTDAVEK